MRRLLLNMVKTLTDHVDIVYIVLILVVIQFATMSSDRTSATCTIDDFRVASRTPTVRTSSHIPYVYSFATRNDAVLLGQDSTPLSYLFLTLLLGHRLSFS